MKLINHLQIAYQLEKINLTLQMLYQLEIVIGTIIAQTATNVPINFINSLEQIAYQLIELWSRANIVPNIVYHITDTQCTNTLVHLREGSKML